VEEQSRDQTSTHAATRMERTERWRQGLTMRTRTRSIARPGASFQARRPGAVKRKGPNPCFRQQAAARA
jgi:hypothetical protein